MHKIFISHTYNIIRENAVYVHMSPRRCDHTLDTLSGICPDIVPCTYPGAGRPGVATDTGTAQS